MSRDYHRKLRVACSDCGAGWNKRADTLSEWSGRCRSCAVKVVKAQPDQKEASRQCLERVKQMPNYHGKLVASHLSSKFKGRFHPSWRGGVTPESAKIRTSRQMSEWRISIFRRDEYTCRKSGVRGSRLVAHHILNFAQHPDLRFDLDNGITLSKAAHLEFHNLYGRKNNTREQIEAYVRAI